MSTPITDAQRTRLLDLVRQMRAIAEPVGCMHAWWDDITDIEALLTGRSRPMFDWTPDQWIAECERSLERHRPSGPPGQ